MVAALSGTAAALITGRIVQGVGGALILPSTLSTVNALFRGRDWAAAFGVWGAVISGAAPGFDAVGFLLSAVSFGGLVHGIIQKNITLTLVAALVLVAFIVWERLRLQQGKVVLLDLSMLRIGAFTWGNLTAMLVAIGEFGLVFVLPLFLVSGMNLSTLAAGGVLAAMAAGAFLSGALARHLAAAIGPSGVVILGLGLEVFGALQLAAEERPAHQPGACAGSRPAFRAGLRDAVHRAADWFGPGHGDHGHRVVVGHEGICHRPRFGGGDCLRGRSACRNASHYGRRYACAGVCGSHADNPLQHRGVPRTGFCIRAIGASVQ